MHRKCISKAPQHWQHHHAGAKECHSTCYIMWCLPDKLVNGATSNLTCRVQGVLRGILMLKPMDGVGGSHLKNRPSNFGVFRSIYAFIIYKHIIFICIYNKTKKVYKRKRNFVASPIQNSPKNVRSLGLCTTPVPEFRGRCDAPSAVDNIRARPPSVWTLHGGWRNRLRCMNTPNGSMIHPKNHWIYWIILGGPFLPKMASPNVAQLILVPTTTNQVLMDDNGRDLCVRH